jgi:hypothetical protein
MTEPGTATPRTCQQTVVDGDDCCASNEGICAGTATWEHAAGGVALCDLHARNAELLGGIQLGYWVVGDTRVPYPEGWTNVEDGRALVVVVPPPRNAAPREPGVRPSGLVLP